MSDFSGVEDTLFVPLVGRIFSSKNYKEFFYDAKAVELEKYIPSEQIKQNSEEYYLVATVARFYEFDLIAKHFIEENKDCNVVNLGCGLETNYFRINDPRATFYELDLPKVIEQRKIVLGENPNEILIGSDIFDYSWMDKIDKTRPTLFIVSGVFQYIPEDKILDLINHLRLTFDNAQIAFDATNKSGIKKANEYVNKTGNEDVKMYFYIDKVSHFIDKSGCDLIKVVPFFQHSKVALKKKLKLSTKFTCFFGDKLGYSKIVWAKI